MFDLIIGILSVLLFLWSILTIYTIRKIKINHTRALINLIEYYQYMTNTIANNLKTRDKNTLEVFMKKFCEIDALVQQHEKILKTK